MGAVAAAADATRASLRCGDASSRSGGASSEMRRRWKYHRRRPGTNRRRISKMQWRTFEDARLDVRPPVAGRSVGRVVRKEAAATRKVSATAPSGWCTGARGCNGGPERMRRWCAPRGRCTGQLIRRREENRPRCSWGATAMRGGSALERRGSMTIRAGAPHSPYRSRMRRRSRGNHHPRASASRKPT